MTQISFLNRILQIISDLIPGNPIEGHEEALARLNPDKIYLENVRSVLGVSTKKALQICDTAVRQGFFRQWIEVRCPDDVVAATAETESQLPEKVRCWQDHNGEHEQVEFYTRQLTKVAFYSLR